MDDDEAFDMLFAMAAEDGAAQGVPDLTALPAGASEVKPPAATGTAMQRALSGAAAAAGVSAAPAEGPSNSSGRADSEDAFDLLLAMAEEGDTGATGAVRSAAGASPSTQTTGPLGKRPAPVLARETSKRPRSAGAAKGPAAFQAAGASQAAPKPAAPVGGSTNIEKFSGLKVKNPLIPSIILRERLSDTDFVRISDVSVRARKGSLDQKWATVFVVADKSKPKESASGRMFSIWGASDLEGAPISLFLFGAAYQDHWKETEGSMFVLYNAKARTEDGKVSLSIDSGDQLCKIGTSADFGYCRGRRKDGGQCRMAVNVNKCPYCEYHVASEFNKVQSKRGALKDSLLRTAFQRPGQKPAGRGAKLPGSVTVGARVKLQSNADMQRVAQSGIGSKGSVGAKYLMRVSGATQAEPSEDASFLNRSGLRYGRTEPKQGATTSSAQAPKACPAGANASSSQQAGRAASSSGAASSSAGRAAAGQLGHAPAPSGRGGTALAGAASQRGANVPMTSQLASRPVAQAHAHQGSGSSRQAGPAAPRQQHHAEALVTLEDDDEIDWAQVDAQDAAKQRALALIKERLPGGLPKPDPNATRIAPAAAAPQPRQAGPSAAQQAPAAACGPSTSTAPLSRAQGGKENRSSTAGPGASAVPAAQPSAAQPSAGQRILDKLHLSGPKQKAAGAASASAKGRATAAPAVSAFAAAFGSVVSTLEEPAQTGTRYQQLVEDEEHERLGAVLGALEKKDAMLAKMEAITKQTVRAWQCHDCKYVAEHRRPECKLHAAVQIQATKRWWACDGCGHRFTTVATQYPLKRCAKCHDISKSFKAVSMARSQKKASELPFATREQFKSRGTEHGFGLNI